MHPTRSTRRPSLTKTSYWDKPRAQLDYIIKDASEAARAMRGMDDVAEAKYLEQVCDATTVIGHRSRRG
jgi:hypothetical protein